MLAPAVVHKRARYLQVQRENYSDFWIKIANLSDNWPSYFMNDTQRSSASFIIRSQKTQARCLIKGLETKTERSEYAKLENLGSRLRYI